MINSHDSRDELKALIDKLPQSDLEPVNEMLEYQSARCRQTLKLSVRNNDNCNTKGESRSVFAKPARQELLEGEVKAAVSLASMQGGVAVGRYHFGYWDGRRL